MITKSFGELHPETISGRLLKLLAGLSVVRTIVEVGTLDGTGSTRSIINGMRDRQDPCRVMCSRPQHQVVAADDPEKGRMHFFPA